MPPYHWRQTTEFSCRTVFVYYLTILIFSPPSIRKLFFELIPSPFFTLRPSYLRIYRTDLNQVFRIGKHVGGHDQFHFV